MLSKLMFWGIFAFLLIDVNALSLNKLEKQLESGEESNKKKEVLESLKEFVSMVDKLNLNVSIIGSRRKYAPGGFVNEDMGLTMHMPVNTEHLTQATLDDNQQDKYLKKIKKLAKTEKVGVRSRVIKIVNGEDKVDDIQEVNEHYFVDSPNYHALTRFRNGKQGFSLPENDTHAMLLDYRIKEPSDDVKSVKIITGYVKIEELEVSKDFPANELEEIKNTLPKLWMAIDDETILSRLLVQHLDKKFDVNNHQMMIGVEGFALSGKQFANLKVGDTNVLVFIL